MEMRDIDGLASEYPLRSVSLICPSLMHLMLICDFRVPAALRLGCRYCSLLHISDC